MSKVEIMTATEEFVPEMAILAQRIWKETYTPLIGANQVAYMVEHFQSAKKIAQQVKSKDFSYLIAVSEKIIVGYLGWQEKNDEIFISKLYIEKSSRQQGVGQQLFQALPKDKKMRLTVNKRNFSAQKVYEKWGFSVVSSVKTAIGEGFFMDDYVYALPQGIDISKVKSSDEKVKSWRKSPQPKTKKVREKQETEGVSGVNPGVINGVSSEVAQEKVSNSAVSLESKKLSAIPGLLETPEAIRLQESFDLADLSSTKDLPALAQAKAAPKKEKKKNLDNALLTKDYAPQDMPYFL
ncbi:GNAT family N-acetyltransferase [Enterococcus timonensis]|uniref:GNAT family N-acetyltransferase n=1 Tax=Enterococcus timonensis TaxID=1852364 RepID=UPI0008D9E201|nr:GNAT family N-acetyltransferase [Enterococcus timonensis]